jgi:tetratricopeptide (TPR) repeat protein
MERSEEAVAAFTRSLKLNEHEDVLLLRGRELGYLDEFDKAIADFKRAAEVAPDDPETQKNSKGNIAYMEGRKAGNPKPVRKTVSEPDPFRAEMDALEFDQPAAARALIDARLKENPASVSALRALSRYHRHRGESEPAFEAIGKAAKIDRDNPKTLREFAEAAKAIQRYGLATQGYSRAILKGDQGAQAARAEMFVANSVAGAALDDLKAAIKLDPDNPRLHFLHSVSLLQQPGESSVKDSAAALEKAVALGYGGMRLYRGQVLEILGRHQQAITEFTIDIESDGVFAGIYLRRASCYRALGKLDLALADFKSAANSAKKGSDVAEVALRNIQSVEAALAADKK